MFYFKDSTDPVGQVQTVESVEKMLAYLKGLWDEQKSKKSFWGSNASVSKATIFLMYALDGLVNATSEAVLTGPDKKATVLDAIDRLYDYTVREALPIWLVPVAVPIKSYVIHVLVSNAIDWIVMKYNNGSWSSKVEPEQKNTTAKSIRRRGRRSK